MKHLLRGVAALVASALLFVCASAQISFEAKARPVGWAGQALYQRQFDNGYVRVMLAGDSMMAGNSSDMGMRLPIALLLKAHGIDPTFVGDVTDNAGTARWFYNTFGNVTKHQSAGGVTTAQLLSGTATLTNSWSAALAANKPDIVFLCVGTNDTSPGVQSQYQQIIDAVYAYRPDCVLVWITPLDSNSVTVSYYNADTGRAATKETIRAAVLARPTAPVIFVDGAQSLGMQTWYPNSDLTTNNNNANAVFADSTHLRHPGWLLPVAPALAAVFGTTADQELETACNFQPYQPVDFADSGQDISASASAVLIAGGQYKRCLTSYVFENQHATDTSTVVLYKRRVSQDGSTTATDTAVLTLKVGAGKIAGYTFPMTGNNSTKATGPVAWYNEGWKVAVTGGGPVNVRITGKSTVY